MKILDVGCGTAKTEGAIGIDRAQLPGVDIVYDLEKMPWPLEPESFDMIVMNDVIEHFPDTLKVMEECHRLLRKGGILKIRVVYWNHRYSYSDPTHKTFFSEVTWEFFTGKRRSYYTQAQFEMVSFKFTYDKIASILFLWQKWLMRPAAYFLCNIIDGMHVELRKV